MADSKISALPSGAPAQSGDEYVVARSGANYKLTLGNMAASMPDTTINGSLVVNEGGADKDTRIEGDTDANLFFADASTDRIGVGTNTPSEKLDVASGNLVFSGTGQRIKADLGGDWATRLIFQNKTTDAETRVTAMPNGSSQIASFSLSNSSTPTNSVTASLRVDGTAVSVSANSEGSATPLPLEFRTTDTVGSSGNTRMTISTAGDVGIGTTTPAAKLDIASGNLTFSSTGQRITGDMSNATLTSRVYFQNSVANSPTVVGALPSGSGSTSAYSVFNASDPTNSSEGQLAVNSTTDIRLSSTIRGTGTYLPMTFYTGGSERMRLTTDGNLGLGTASPGSRVTLGVNATDTALSGTSNTAGLHMYVRAFGVAQIDSIQSGANNSGMSLRTYNNGTYTAFIENTQGNTTTFATAGTTRMTIDSSGNVGIGGTGFAFDKVVVTGTLPTDSNVSINYAARGTAPSGTTTTLAGFNSFPATAAASFTCTDVIHFNAAGLTIGAGSTVTNQYGFRATDQLTGATNNYGFYSNIASAANRWNFYANGTAANYFAGNTGIGRSPLYRLDVEQTADAPTARIFANQAGFLSSNQPVLFIDVDNGTANSTASFSIIADYNGTEQFKVRNDGTIYAQNTTVQSISDNRVKENVRTATEGLSVIDALRPVRFDFKNGFGNNRKNQLGFVAQEVEAVFPDAVDVMGDKDENGDPYKSVGPAALIPVLVKAIQELSARLAALEAK